jgi:hypothetical protein
VGTTHVARYAVAIRLAPPAATSGNAAVDVDGTEGRHIGEGPGQDD